jgi:transglutaminase-like putative cysteine protease
VKYEIKHITEFAYNEPVTVCHNKANLTPPDLPTQHCEMCRIEIRPTPAVMLQRRDYYGNITTFFTMQEPHRKLTVSCASIVEVRERSPVDAEATPPWETVRERLRTDRDSAILHAYQFTFDSSYVRSDAELRKYALLSFPSGRPVLAGALDLTARIHAEFEYDAEATDLATPLETVLAERRGVCQDFAHLQIGCLRSLGLAARYVSGYLRTLPPPGMPRLVGADASHAWLSVFVPELGWIDLDPTNNRACGTDHITLSWGRDYDEVSPIRGVILGGGAQVMSVSVDVSERE